VATPIVRGLGAAFLAGVLNSGEDRGANPINAELLAERNRVRLTTVGEGAHHHFNTLISAEISGETGRRSGAVTVFGLIETRLVALDDVWLDIPPVGSMVVFENLDQPGVLAAVSTVLARHDVNIADVSLGRREGTGHAVTVMRIDSDLDSQTMKELCDLKVVQNVHTLRFGPTPG
jgi:D-3-phosphoglycerate dehydrogenase